MSKTPPTRMVEVANAEDARSLLEAWEHLAERPLERNVFAESWMLLPALETLVHDEEARAGIVVDTSTHEVLGVFPFVRNRRWNRLPITVASGWIHEQSYLGTPLLHPAPELAKHAIVGFLDALAAEHLVEFNDVAGDGEFMHLLMEVIAERKLGWLLTDSVTRPVLRPRDDADSYLAEALDGDARRKLRSKEKGLRAVGPLRTEVAEVSSEVEAWLETFIRLEASGWKGAQGGALAHNPGARRYVEVVVREACRRGRVMALTLRVGDRPVAMKLNLSSGDEWFAYKIAYDPDFARFSPGLQLEVENIRRVHSLGKVRWMDSCTGPTIRVFRDVWLDRRSIQSLVIATGCEPAALALASWPLLRWGKQRADLLSGPTREGHPTYKATPRQAAARPLASRQPLAKRLAATPLAVAAAELAGAGASVGHLGAVLRQAVRLQCACMDVASFHDQLDAFFAAADWDGLLFTLNYRAIRPALLESAEPFIVHGARGSRALTNAVRAAGHLSIRLDFQRLLGGDHIPPHGHARTVSGFSVIEGSVAVRRYHVIESLPDSLTLRSTFDGILRAGQASTESDARDNVHWIVALEDTVLFRITVSHVPCKSPMPTTLNAWVDPRSPVRGDGNVLARWIPEHLARKIQPFARGSAEAGQGPGPTPGIGESAGESFRKSEHSDSANGPST
jgi:CelD/BcsL family acetyltransferase involved in cellulose biosynthesis